MWSFAATICGELSLGAFQQATCGCKPGVKAAPTGIERSEGFVIFYCQRLDNLIATK
jgi:hypothetical protein